MRLYPEMLAGVSSGWESLSEAGEAENARLLADTPEREPQEIADAIEVAAPKLREAFSAYTGELELGTLELQLPPAAIVGIQVADMFVHGWDVATAFGRHMDNRPSGRLPLDLGGHPYVAAFRRRGGCTRIFGNLWTAAAGRTRFQTRVRRRAPDRT